MRVWDEITRNLPHIERLYWPFWPFCSISARRRARASPRSGRRYLDQPGDNAPHTDRGDSRQKQFGAIWCARWLGIGLIAILGAGLVLGAIHPLGLLAGIAILVSSAWLTAAIGVLASTLASNSTRALFLTALVVFGYVMITSWPSGFWQTLASYREMQYANVVRPGRAGRVFPIPNLVTPPLGGLRPPSRPSVRCSRRC